ncbi:MAG: pyrroline-5-carboxylate reductase [bacterium]|nr:MAG: pyrroline-5-carboxylate reductase [bacterium]
MLNFSRGRIEGKVEVMDYRSAISFIGGGNMAEALAGGIVRAGILPAELIIISEPRADRSEYLKQTYGFTTTFENRQAAVGGGTIFLAVKPQVVPGVLGPMADSLGKEKLVISVAAGVSLSYLQQRLPGTPVIRAMPNTPALLGCGATVISPGRGVQADMTHWAVELFKAVGSCHILPEDLMDAVTGLSGSGPAYIFRMAEALTEAGMAEGIPEETAGELVRQTILGAARMMVETGKTPTQLREMVTSPGGTTQAGMESMEESNFDESVVEAVMAAAKRARELGSS